MNKRRILCYAQHLSGVGHMIRTQHIAMALAQHNQVTITDGGRVLPFPAGLQTLALPRITRRQGELVSLEAELSLQEAFQLRAQRLGDYLATTQPDAILVEHYPFSKWGLGAEIDALLQAARLCNPAIKVICSLRDIAPRTRHEHAQHYSQTVLQTLNQQFDALLVHADPRLCSLPDFFGQHDDIGIPVCHTGVVVPQPAAPPPSNNSRSFPEGEYVVASIGGGADDAKLLQRVTRAWRTLRAEKALDSTALLLFGGLAAPVSEDEANEEAIYQMGFDPHFRYWLQGAKLSISCAGYNTCANLLVSATPALLVPNLKMSDQLKRARLMAEKGVARYVPPPDPVSDPLPGLIIEGLNSSPAPHDIDIDGAGNSAHYIEALVSGLQVQ